MKKDHEADARLPSPQGGTPSGPAPPAPLRSEGTGLRSRVGAQGAGVLMVAREVSPGSGNSDRHRQATTKTTGITHTRTHTQTRHRSAHATLRGKGDDYAEDCSGVGCGDAVLGVCEGAAAGGWFS